MSRFAALAGGVGAARFLSGVQAILQPDDQLTIVGNTGDDLELWGLHISPDLDSVLYTLAGLNDEERGWGLRGETFNALDAMGRLRDDTWFSLGDRDLATHLHRTQLLRDGATLTAVTQALTTAFGLRPRLLPMSNDPVRTRVRTRDGWLDFQEYFVRRRFEDEVLALEFRGADRATPAPGVLEALTEAEAILIAPSNPFVSVGPILALDGVREALVRPGRPVIAVTPIIGGAAVKGPAARMLASLGFEVSPVGVARYYQGIISDFVIDQEDEDLASEVEALGLRVTVTNTWMSSAERRAELARVVLDAVA